MKAAAVEAAEAEVSGDPNRPALVFIDRLGQPLRQIAGSIEGLHRVIRPDHRNHPVVERDPERPGVIGEEARNRRIIEAEL